MNNQGRQPEELRLQAIARYEILDTPPEATFDRIVAIVRAVLDVPIAAITLVDSRDSWYKSHVGMPSNRFRREDNMCDAVISQDGVFVISDSHSAPQALVQPLLNAGFRFYAGAPLRTPDGVKIGTLCAADLKPRELTEKERDILVNLAAIVIDEMELRLQARKIAEADAALQRLNAELERASRNKSEFLASMSHELRTPLNGILGASELLLQGLFGELSPRQEEYLRDIHQSGTHLLRLIEDVLDLSRIEAGQMELHPERLDVAELMESCLAVVRGVADAGSLQLSLEPPSEKLALQGDQRRLTQVACNLLSNALKFSPPGGAVRFRAARDGNEVVFTVEDEGPGIAAEDQPLIFEQFYRVATDKEGTGLGLPLAKRLLELHGGRIWLESSPGAGSRFYFALPAA